jgi:hypothetical protein
MASIRSLLSGIVLTAFLLHPRPTLSKDWFDYDLSLRLSNRFNLKRNFLNTEGTISSSRGNQEGQGYDGIESPLNLRFDKDETGYSMFVGVGADLRFGEHLSAHLTVDSGLLVFPPLVSYEPRPTCKKEYEDPRCQITSNARRIRDEAEKTWFVREAFLEMGGGRDQWFTARAGKLLVSTGNGFIMDNYALGGMLVFDLDLGYEIPLKITLDGLLPNGDFTPEGKSSPLVYLDVAYLLSFFEEIGLFVAWYHDGDDNLGGILRSTMDEMLGHNNPLLYGVMDLAEVTSRGEVFWVGLRGNRIFDRASLSVTAILEFGGFDFTARLDVPELGEISRSGSPSCLGGMVDVSFHYDIADYLTLGAYFLFLSGETYGANQLVQGAMDYTSFISIYPYITRTNLFFSGGMNESFSARSFGTSGVNGRGLISPGLTAGIDITENAGIRLVSALLFSHGAHLESGGHFYGWESDLNFHFNLGKHMRILFEADYLLTGNFFDFRKPLESRAVSPFIQEPNAYKILLGFDVFF